VLSKFKKYKDFNNLRSFVFRFNNTNLDLQPFSTTFPDLKQITLTRLSKPYGKKKRYNLKFSTPTMMKKLSIFKEKQTKKTSLKKEMLKAVFLARKLSTKSKYFANFNFPALWTNIMLFSYLIMQQYIPEGNIWS
jgi:hypothetical protein